MSSVADNAGLAPLIIGQNNTMWRYVSLRDYFDSMLSPGYFRTFSDRFRAGDFIVVVSPSWFDVVRPPYGPPYVDYRKGGGLLRVEEQENGVPIVVPLSEGMILFSEAREHANRLGDALEIPDGDTAAA